MPRRPRRKCESGIYHVMLRGINKQPVFFADADKTRFLHTLQKYKEQCGFHIYGYCLMNNHVHLLIKETEAYPLNSIVKRIAGSYAYWYNLSYQRIGHLFQDRFRSEPVEDDGYFLTVLRYIHQNPLKAGLCRKLSQYKWSSYEEYKTQKATLTDVDFAIEMTSHKSLLEFFAEDNEDECLEDNEVILPKTAEQWQQLFSELSGCETAAEFADLPPAKQQEIIIGCFACGFSRKKIAELTGTSRTFVAKRLK